MKKGLLVLVLAILVSTGAFAQMSAGAGLFFANDFGGGGIISESIPPFGTLELTMEMPNAGFGTFGFFDLTYAEVTIGFYSGKGDMTMRLKIPGVGEMSEKIGEISFTGVNFGLLGKYPISVGNAVTLFPLLGIEYQRVVSGEIIEGGYTFRLSSKEAADFSTLWFKAGAGMDYSLTDMMYLRFSFLYGLRLANKLEKELVEMFAEDFEDIPGVSVDTRLGHGLTIKAAIGFKF